MTEHYNCIDCGKGQGRCADWKTCPACINQRCNQCHATYEVDFAKKHPCLGHQPTGERFECIDCGHEDQSEYFYLDDRCIVCHHSADKKLIAELRAEVSSFESEWKTEQQMRIDAEDKAKAFRARVKELEDMYVSAEPSCKECDDYGTIDDYSMSGWHPCPKCHNTANS